MKFSVVIALAPERKIKVLESFERVNYPKSKYEIIVEEGENPSVNRNKGSSKAKNEILAFVDDDAVVDENWLDNAADFFKEYEDIAVLGGPQLTPKDDGFFARSSGLVISSYFGSAGMSKRYKKGKLNFNADEFSLSSANCFIRKKVFDEVGGFNPDLFPGEDPELFARVKKENYKIVYSPDVFVYHKRRGDFLSFCRQFYLYGKARVKKEKALKSLPSPLFLLPSLFLIYLLALPVLAFVSLLFNLPLVLYLGLAVLHSLIYAIKNKNPLLLILLPFLYLALHISYGVGVIRGFI